MTPITSKPKLLIALPLILVLASCQNSFSSKTSDKEAAANDPSKTIISTYLGGQVTLRDVNIEIEKLIAKNDKLKGLTFDKLSAEQKETIIKEVVLKEIAYKEAKRRSLNKDKDYQETLKIFESELLKQKLFADLIKKASSEENVKKSYDELAAKIKNKKDIQISYITVKTQSEAESLYQFLVKFPNSFAASAKRKSLDKEVGKKGGNLGFVMEDMLPKEIVGQARSVAKGQVARPVQSSDKWVIVKFEDERPAEIISFEKSKDALAQNLAKKAIEDFVSKSLKEAQISILVK